ncbi:MAG: J domain-containing protein [Syntrophobacteraceae bacterium]|nr:J domain-containing protein [Syntrophobacteraceae bacterium]
MGRCYYKILGISFKATEDEIRRSFRLLALRYHPDRNPDSPDASERFREAMVAYETLVDRSRRYLYDRRRGFVRATAGRPARWTADADQSGSSASHEDILEELFGVRPGARSEVGFRYDLRFDLQVHRSVLRDGGLEEISFSRALCCPDCNGSRRLPRGFFCRVCGGAGQVEEQCCIKVSIPAGLEDGSRLRMQGLGDCMRHGLVPGDLVVVLHAAD